ncbi:hypothetical protein ABGB12_34700 [Actinocorallia sp. B10E7]|uniref:hypothetical protein n=1 Tax=Actinocorallia sp. B10E7 TaxID=3153558 RepID=UPI00325DC293
MSGPFTRAGIGPGQAGGGRRWVRAAVIAAAIIGLLAVVMMLLGGLGLHEIPDHGGDPSPPASTAPGGHRPPFDHG